MHGSLSSLEMFSSDSREFETGSGLLWNSTTTFLTDSTMYSNDSTALGHGTGNSTINATDYVDLLHYLNNQYRKVHGELSFSVCVFGVITNILNIIVLSRKNMISPTNAILTGMAVSDCAVIASYIPFLGAYYLRPASADQYSFGWAVFTLCHAHITVVFHTISIWLTVLLAIWRYLTVRSAGNSRWYCSMTRAKIAIVLTYAIVPVFCIPVFLCFTIYPEQQTVGSGVNATNITLYKVDMVQTHGELLSLINFWAFSVFLKLIPCILLTCLSLALIRILIEARKRKERLFGTSATKPSLNHNSNHHHHHNNHNNSVSKQPLSIHRSGNSSPYPGGNANPGEKADGSPTGNGDGEGTNQLYLEIAESSPTISNTSGCSKPRNFLARVLAFFPYRLTCFGSDGDRATSGDRIQLKLRKTRPETTGNHAPLHAPLHHTHHHHHHHRHHHHHHQPSPVPQPPSTRQQASSSGNSERTTRMLIAVLIVFLVCESPSGVLALLSAINGKAFFDNIYFNFGEMMDMLALINSAVNFILYCFMSQQFRKTFSQLFCICWWTEEVAGNVAGPVSGFVRNPPGATPREPGNVPNNNMLNLTPRPVVASASAMVVTQPNGTGSGPGNGVPKSGSAQNLPRAQSDLNAVAGTFVSSSDDDPLPGRQTGSGGGGGDSLTGSATDRETVSETSSIHMQDSFPLPVGQSNDKANNNSISASSAVQV